GKTAQKHRTKSSCRLIHGFCCHVGMIGQNGIDTNNEYAVHPIDPAARNWQIPSATRGRSARRAMEEPIALPMPSPSRNTASVIAAAVMVAVEMSLIRSR